MRATISMLALLALGACGDGSDDAAPNTSTLIAANAAKDRAMLSGDAVDLERFYTADYQVIDDDGKVHDKRDQVEFMTKKIDLLDARSDDVRVNMLSRNAALLTGRMTGRYREDGKEVAFAERYTSIWVTEDNQWRVRHEHSSTLAKPR